MSTTTSDQSNQEIKQRFRLKKTVGVWRGISILYGVIIGAGIFVTPGGVLIATWCVMLQNTESSNGSVGLSLIVWVCGGIIGCLSALCMCELATTIGESGGNFTYFTVTYGPSVGFLLMWTEALAPFGTAVKLMSLSLHAIEIFTNGCPAPGSAITSLAVSFVFMFAYIQCQTTKGTLKLEVICTCAKFAVLAAIVVAGIVMLIKGNPVGIHNFKTAFDAKPMETMNWGNFVVAFYQVIWPFTGWNGVAYIIEEVRNPSKVVPLTTIGTLALVTLTYLLVNIGFLSVLTVEEIMESKAVAGLFASRLFGSMSWLVPSLICLCIAGSINAAMFVQTRPIFAAARRNHLPQILSMPHIHHFTPSPATSFHSLGILVLVLISDFDTALEVVGIMEWMNLGLNAGSVLILRKKHPNIPRPYKAPIFAPVLVVLFSIVFLLSPIISKPRISYFYSLFYIGSSFLVYFVFVRPKRKFSFVDKMTIFIQKLFQVAPTDFNPKIVK